MLYNKWNEYVDISFISIAAHLPDAQWIDCYSLKHCRLKACYRQLIMFILEKKQLDDVYRMRNGLIFLFGTCGASLAFRLRANAPTKGAL